MQQQAESTATDPLLLPYLSAASEEEAREHLSYLLWDVARPVAQNVIRRLIGATFYPSGKLPREDAEDICSKTLEKLVKHLNNLKFEIHANHVPIRNFSAYVAVVTERTFYDSALIENVRFQRFDSGRNTEASFLQSSLVSNANELSHQPSQWVENQERVERLWHEVCQLSLRQRRVFLLGMREEKGTGDVLIFFIYNVCSFKELPRALDVSPEWFYERWRKRTLPLEDVEIGAMVSCTGQQVSNIRKAVIERLARRLKSCA